MKNFIIAYLMEFQPLSSKNMNLLFITKKYKKNINILVEDYKTFPYSPVQVFILIDELLSVDSVYVMKDFLDSNNFSVEVLDYIVNHIRDLRNEYDNRFSPFSPFRSFLQNLKQQKNANNHHKKIIKNYLKKEVLS